MATAQLTVVATQIFELIDKAIEAEMHNLRMRHPRDKPYFIDALDFRQKNPNCCEINRDDAPAGFPPAIARSVGFYRSDVLLSYRWTHDPTEAKPYRISHLFITECGTVADHMVEELNR